MKRLVCTLLTLGLLLLSLAGAEALLENFDSVSRISEDTYLICKDKLWGMARGDGEIILKPQFRREPVFDGDYAVVSINHGITGQDVSGEYEPLIDWGVINKKGEVVIPLQYDSLILSDDGRIATVEKDGLFGFIETSGRAILEPVYSAANGFSGGYCAVAVSRPEQSGEDYSSANIDCRWGIVDETGKEVVKCQYKSLELQPNNLAIIWENNKYGLIDVQGNLIVPPKYDILSPFVGDYAGVAMEMREINDSMSAFSYGVIDCQGKIVVPLEYDNLTICSENRARVCIDGRYGLIDFSGNDITKMEFAIIRDFYEGCAVAEKADGKYGVIDLDGQTVLPFEYDRVDVLNDHLLRAERDGKVEWFKVTDGKAVPTTVE